MAKLTQINPDNVPDYLTYGLSHAVVAEGGRTIYLSGQVGWNAKSESVGPDLAAQLAQAHENIRRVLAEAGGTVADIVRLNTYVAGYVPEEGEGGERRQPQALRGPRAPLDDAHGRSGALFPRRPLRGRGDGGHRVTPHEDWGAARDGRRP